MLLMRPVPRVRFMNSFWKPIRPRAGMRYSRRTRPMPSVSMFTSSALRSPSACITPPWCWSSTSAVTSSIGSWRSPVDLVEHDARLAHRELVAFAAHVLQQDGQVQLAAARDLEDAVFVGLPHLQRDVALQLALQPVPDLAAGDELAFAAGQRRVVDAEVHRQRRLVDAQHRQRLRVVQVGDRHADADVLDAVDQHDVARPGLLGLAALQPLELQHLVDARACAACCPGPRTRRRPSQASACPG